MLIAVFTAFGMIVGFRMANESNGVEADLVKSYDDNSSGQVGRVEELLRFIEAKYVDDVDEQILIDAATKAIFDKLDPHSVYIPPDDIERINEGMSGYYKGIGIETILLDDTLRITKIVADSPAESSGILYGDKLLKVNDTIVAGVKMPIQKQWGMLKTKEGQSVTLTMLGRNKQKRELVLTPDKIKYPNVQFFYVDDIPYIKISKFSDDTYEELVKGLESFQKDMQIPSLILDLRNNRGGYLQEATKILNQLFVEDKRLMVYTKGKSKKSEYNTTGRPFYKVGKLAVLINRSSASASEIIAGAVQDWDKAVIIGEQSYGKGLVQDQYELSNGGSIRLTTARYFTPTGRYIQTPFESDNFSDTIQYKTMLLQRPLVAQGGITPDIEIDMDDVEHSARELANMQVNGDAYEFIIENDLRKSDKLDFQSESMLINLSKSAQAFSDLHGLLDPLSIRVYTSMIKQEIFDQLEMYEGSQKEMVNSDVFIEKAVEVLSKEDIFADLVD